MQTEMTTMLMSTFGRMMQDEHPISYARQANTLANASHAALWAALTEGGWLEVGCDDFQRENREQTALLGELTGRALLTLPLGFSAFLLAPLVEAVPALLASGTVLPIAEHPASGRSDGADAKASDSDVFMDYFGDAAQYYRLTAPESIDGDWLLQRFEGTDVEVVDSLDPCIALGRFASLAPVAQLSFSMPSARMRDLLCNYLAFELAHVLGAASATLDSAIAYAKTREQFGRPIGQFQAVKHPLADAWVGLDNGRYAIRKLLVANDSAATGHTCKVAGIANRLVTDAAKQAAKLAIQVHGGLGFSWEQDNHLFLKRIHRMSLKTAAVAAVLS